MLLWGKQASITKTIRGVAYLSEQNKKHSKLAGLVFPERLKLAGLVFPERLKLAGLVFPERLTKMFSLLKLNFCNF